MGGKGMQGSGVDSMVAILRHGLRTGQFRSPCRPESPEQYCAAAARIIFMATTPKQPDLTPSVPAGGDSVVLERRTQRVEPPKMYQVVLLNDDFTPMEFVVLVLQEYFNKDRETATQIMLKIHLEGRGICGVFSRDVAATKVEQVLQASRHHGHPLQCLAEPVE
jgi:ATP-dependent Clp protease adaptor protein ClpS